MDRIKITEYKTRGGMNVGAAFEKLYYNLAENRPVPTFVTARPQIVLKSNLPLYQK